MKTLTRLECAMCDMPRVFTVMQPQSWIKVNCAVPCADNRCSRTALATASAKKDIPTVTCNRVASFMRPRGSREITCSYALTCPYFIGFVWGIGFNVTPQLFLYQYVFTSFAFLKYERAKKFNKKMVEKQTTNMCQQIRFIASGNTIKTLLFLSPFA